MPRGTLRAAWALCGWVVRAERCLMFKAGVVGLALVMGMVGAGVGWAQSSRTSRTEGYFRLEWEPGQTKSGRPAVRGYIHNDNGIPASRARFVVESLDASGRVVSRTVGYVNGDIMAKGSAFFEVTVPAPAVTYRVTMESFDWQQAGGGGY